VTPYTSRSALWNARFAAPLVLRRVPSMSKRIKRLIYRSHPAGRLAAAARQGAGADAGGLVAAAIPACIASDPRAVRSNRDRPLDGALHGVGREHAEGEEERRAGFAGLGRRGHGERHVPVERRVHGRDPARYAESGHTRERLERRAPEWRVGRHDGEGRVLARLHAERRNAAVGDGALADGALRADEATLHIPRA